MSLHSETDAVKRTDPAAQREILIHLLRGAQGRARLNATTLETIMIQLKHRQVTVEQAWQWIREQDLENYLQLGPKGGVS
jgi:tyrosyl-tRNA synthetase